MVIAGIVLIIVGVVLFLVRRSQRARLSAILATEKSTVRGLTELAKMVGEQLGGPGSFYHAVAVEGAIKCDAPLTSEIGKELCVYYETTIDHEYEETYYERDSETKQQVARTRRSRQTMASNKRSVPFWVEDATGLFSVDPHGAHVDAERSVDRFEPSASLADGALAYGDFRLELGSVMPRPGSRTLGYHIRESILPLGRRVYVLGEASDASGRLQIQKPKAKGGQFIVSLKSEEELLRSTASKVRWLQYGTIGCWVVGVVLAVAGLIAGR